MQNDESSAAGWPTPNDYGNRFREINERLERSSAFVEYGRESREDAAILEYRLAKLAIAAEDLRRAIGVIEKASATDPQLAEVLAELRGACIQICDSFADADERIIRLMNFLDV